MTGNEPDGPIAVSFVIPTRNRGALLERTVLSILAQKRPGAIEIIIIDNQSLDDTSARVERLAASAHCSLRMVTMRENRGPAASRNHGAALSRGQYITFVDSDVTLREDWLLESLAAFDVAPDIGLIAGKVVFASDESTICSWGGELSPLGLGWDADQGRNESALDGPRYRLWAPSASFIVLRSAFEQTGGFDESYFYGYEDSDFGWRLHIAGWRCLMITRAIAVHATTDQIDDHVRKQGPEIVFHYSKNRLRSMIKNAGSARLWMWTSAATAWLLLDSLLRSPRKSRIRALLWNLRMLPDTLAMRTRVQATRRANDAAFRDLFADALFPPQPLEKRLRQQPVSPRRGQSEAPQAARVVGEIET